MKYKRAVYFLLASMLVLSLLAACTPPAAAPASSAPSTPKEVVIGAIYPMTGASAQIGQDAKAAIELAVDIVNNKYDLNLPLAQTEGLPNLGGAKVRVIFGDHQAAPEKGQAEAERLITQEKAVALLGSYHSSVTKVASETAERLKIPFVCPESSSATLHTRGLKYFFRTTPHDGLFSQAMFDYIDYLNKNNNANIKKLALFHEDTLFGTSSADAQKEIAKKLNYEIVEDIKYPQNATSLNAELLRLKAAKPDVVLTTSYPSDAILFVNTAVEVGYTPPLVIAQDAGYVEPNFINSVGKIAEGLVSRAVWSEELMTKKPIVGQINELYKKKTGKDIADNSAREFTATLVLLDAINRAGSTDPAAIQKALVETDMKGDQIIMPWPGIKFDATGQNSQSIPMMIQLQGGKYKIVWPPDAATAKLIYPDPDWTGQ